MTVQERKPDRMPQPERWLSEHWFLVLGVLVALIIIVILWAT